MRFIGKYLLRGLLAILPTAVTIYLLYWIGSSAEYLVGRGLRFILPEGYYWTGMGLAAGIAFLFFLGVLTNAWIVKKIFQWQEKLFERIPLVKNLYGSMKDLMSYFSGAKKKSFNKVVAVEVAGMNLVGLVTRENLENVPSDIASDDKIIVYLPMSYQLGGYMVFVPRSAVTPVDMPVDQALSFVLTAGMIQDSGGKEIPDEKISMKRRTEV